MKFVRIISIFIALMVIFASISPRARAHDPHECQNGFPDEPTFAGHLNQADIVNGFLSFDQIFATGEELFSTIFNKCDGQGRPATTGTGDKRVADEPAFIRTSAPDSNSCAGCHAQPRPGGGGDFAVNVFVLAQALDPVTPSVSDQFSDERNTLGMFGSGPIEMLAREMTTELQMLRAGAIQQATTNGMTVTQILETKGINFGLIMVFPDGSVDTGEVKGVDADLIVKPFHQAGVVVSLREFSNNAFNHHHGMQAEERFDLNPTKGVDFDEDGIDHELTIGDITAVTLYQAALGTPGQVLPKDKARRQMIDQGAAFFDQAGCTSCHLPEMTLNSPFFVEPNPFNPSGNLADTSQSFAFDMTKTGEWPRLQKGRGGEILVRAYTDLKRHDLCDDPTDPEPIRFFCNEQFAQDRPDQDGLPGMEFFLTRKLWDVGNSAPYGHRGDLTTITEAILAHGGEARATRDAFVALPTADQAAIVKFLKTLQVLPPDCKNLVVREDDPCLRKKPGHPLGPPRNK